MAAPGRPRMRARERPGQGTEGEATPLGFGDQTSNLGSEKSRGDRMKSGQRTDGAATNPPFPYKLAWKENTLIHHNAVQVFATKDL